MSNVIRIASREAKKITFESNRDTFISTGIDFQSPSHGTPSELKEFYEDVYGVEFEVAYISHAKPTDKKFHYMLENHEEGDRIYLLKSEHNPKSSDK